MRGTKFHTFARFRSLPQDKRKDYAKRSCFLEILPFNRKNAGILTPKYFEKIPVSFVQVSFWQVKFLKNRLIF